MTTTEETRPVEGRLVAALRARAELVQPEGLTHHSAPASIASRRRRRFALIAAAAAVLVAVPLLAIRLSQDDHGARFGSLPGNAGLSLPVDVDGDGDSDLVTVGDDGRLTISRGQDGEATIELPAGSRLLGLARFAGGVVGVGSRSEVVVAVPDDAGDWSVRLIAGDGTDLTTSIQAPVPRITDSSTVWVAKGVLYAGQWSKADAAAQRVRVDTRLFEAGFDSIISRQVGTLCWDRKAQPYPTACSAEDETTLPITPREELPPMFPAQPTEFLRPGDPTWTMPGTRAAGPAWRLRLVADGADARLIYSLGSGKPRSVVIPGPSPAVVKVAVGAGSALVVHDTAAGVSAQVYTLMPDGLAPIPIRSDIPLAAGAGSDGVEHDFWVAEDGVLYSRRIDAADPARGDVWQWTVVARGSRVWLKPTSLGTVCLDLAVDPVRYARC